MPSLAPVVMQRAMHALPERVWQLWTDPALVALWFSPNPALEVTATTGRDAGAPWSVAMGPYIVRGTYQEVDPPRRLSFTWAFDHEADAPPALVTVDLQHAESGTLVTVTHAGFTDEADRAGVEQGWTLSLDRLRELTA